MPSKNRGVPQAERSPIPVKAKPAYLEKLLAPPSARTVTVACKIPTGLQLQLQTKQPRAIDTQDGLKSVDFWVKGGKVYWVAGPSYPTSPPPDYPPPPLIVGGYAVTSGIPADFWNIWVEQNALADFVAPPDGAEHGMIFAYPSLEDASAAAKEQTKLLSGMEPLSRAVDKDGRLTDPRVPRPLQRSMRIGPEQHPGGGETSITLPA